MCCSGSGNMVTDGGADVVGVDVVRRDDGVVADGIEVGATGVDVGAAGAGAGRQCSGRKWYCCTILVYVCVCVCVYIYIYIYIWI